MGEKTLKDSGKVFDSSDSEELSRQSSLCSLRLGTLPRTDSYTGTFTFNSSQNPRPHASDSSKIPEAEADPWSLYKEKLDREIALDSQRLVRLKESANSVKSGKSSNHSVSLREYNSDLMFLGDLEEDEESKESALEPDASLTHKPKKADMSEMDLETAKFQHLSVQDLSEPPERLPPPPKPIVRTEVSPAAELQEPAVAETPQQPGEPIVNRLQRTFKVTHRVPKELLAGQTLDGLRHIIEILISDKQNLQDQLSSVEPAEKKSLESSMSGEDMRPSNMSPTPNHSFNTAQSTSIMRQRMFPVRNQGNQEELMMRRTNNQSTYQKPPRRVRESMEPEAAEEEQGPVRADYEPPQPLAKTMKTFDSYEAELIRLQTELEALKTKNSLLSQVLRLAPEKRRISELANQMQARLEQQTAVIHSLMDENAVLKARIQVVGVTERMSSCTPSRAASPAGSAFQGGSQFFTYETEGQSSVRRVSPKPVAVMKELVSDEETLSLRPEERHALQTLIDLHASGDEKRFEDYLAALLSKHDHSEFAGVLIKYIRYLEEDVFYNIRRQVLELRTKVVMQDAVYQEALSEKAKVDVEVKELRSSLDDLRFELDRVNTRFQMELRRGQPGASLAATQSTSRLMKAMASTVNPKAGSGISLYVGSITKEGGKPKEPYKLMTQKGNFSPWSTMKKS